MEGQDKHLYPSELEIKLTKKKTIDDFNAKIQRKSLIRYLTVIIDFSAAARKQEMRPNRAIVIKSYLTVSLSLFTMTQAIRERFLRLEPAIINLLCRDLQRKSEGPL